VACSCLPVKRFFCHFETSLLAYKSLLYHNIGVSFDEEKIKRQTINLLAQGEKKKQLTKNGGKK
jgi:hypothetical protein